MTAPINHAKLGFILPAVLNPATAAVVGIGLIALGLYRLLDDDEEEATVDAAPINGPEQAVLTVETRLPAVELSGIQPVYEPSNDAQQPAGTVPETLETPPAAISEADQSEMIRKAMSELGKRSAAARAKKKAERDAAV
jgi:hypothetical protein